MPAEHPAPPERVDAPDPQQVLRDARAKFVAAFPTELGRLDDLVAQSARRAPAAELRQLAHRIAGFAGTVGFPTVSARAEELEALLDDPRGQAIDLALARDMVAATREAFSLDLSRPPAWTAAPGTRRGRSLAVLVIEDNRDQADVIASHLRASGHRPLLVASGDRALAAARAERPDVVLLDIELPGMDGYAVCRLLKADPALVAIPVAFITTRSGLDDRLTGLTLGADEFLTKPLDMRELLLRVSLLAERTSPAPPVVAAAPAATSSVLAYYEFVDAARSALASAPGAVALVRVPLVQSGAAAAALLNELRRRDTLGWYDATHLLVMLPGVTADEARAIVENALARLAAARLAPIHAGIAASAAPDANALESLIAGADEALAQARGAGRPVATVGDRPSPVGRRRLVVVGDDDPEVVRIVDAQLRHEGFETILAFDGAQVLDAITTKRPDVLLLDLVMPKRSGFDVLAAAQRLEPRPRVVVLSARDREEDAQRAFELGADDYLFKPFSPQELRARISRLLR